MARTLITMPKTAKQGEIIEIRTLIAHPMETGYRAGENGAILPRNIIRRLSCRYFDGHDDVEIFNAELFPAIAANPFVSFSTTATATGVLRFSWEGDNGFAQSESVNLTVT
jgi:sulfur-oxidizing protein SoxZ